MNTSSDKKLKEKQEVLLRWLTPADLEREFGFSRNNQGQMRMKKKIPFSKVGGYIRYDRHKIDKWLENHEVDVA